MSVSIVVGTQSQLVRFSYLQVFDPKPDPFNPESGELFYSLVAMVDKGSSEIMDQLKNGLVKAIDEGIEKRRLSAKIVGKYITKLKANKTFPVTLRGSEPYVPIQDGDYFVKMEKKTSEFSNHWFFNLRTSSPVTCFNSAKEQIMDDQKGKYFSGWYGRLVINLSAYGRPNQGIGFYLSKVQFVKPGERLDGGLSADEAFGSFEDDESIEVDDTDPTEIVD